MIVCQIVTVQPLAVGRAAPRFSKDLNGYARFLPAWEAFDLLRLKIGYFVIIANCYNQAMYQIVYKKKAIKSLVKMPTAITAKFKAAFYAIADGQPEHLDINALEGLNGFRLRIGNYRAIYETDNGRLIVTVFNIGSRGDICK